MNKIYQNKSLKYLWLLLTFLFFNYSIDIPDSESEKYKEDLSYNDIESFTEFFIEKILDYENAVPESDDDDSDDFSLKIKKIDLQIVELKPILEKKKHFKVFKVKISSFKKSALINPYLLVEDKPPQV